MNLSTLSFVTRYVLLISLRETLTPGGHDSTVRVTKSLVDKRGDPILTGRPSGGGDFRSGAFPVPG